ncbi:hypothetical protein GCM10010421_09770 [Streptomyces glaucus]|uniref:Secreted protein n=1 Tax=Streptomyces glaucus TaxID=284029 RepID=A0ABN3J9C3_9ACTN
MTEVPATTPATRPPAGTALIRDQGVAGLAVAFVLSLLAGVLPAVRGPSGAPEAGSVRSSVSPVQNDR